MHTSGSVFYAVPFLRFIAAEPKSYINNVKRKAIRKNSDRLFPV